MKARMLFVLATITLLASSCQNPLTEQEAEDFRRELSKVDTVLVVTVSGSVDDDLHGVVSTQASNAGYFIHHQPMPVEVNGEEITQARNWILITGDARADDTEQANLAANIQHLVIENGGDASNMSLLVVGKSLGAILSWVTFMNYDEIVFSDFRRVALVLIDPHGSADDDDSNCAHRDSCPLHWPKSYPTDTGFFRVYHIFQTDGPGITGAPFEDVHVCKSEDLTPEDIGHTAITSAEPTKEMVSEAFQFAWYGEDWWTEKYPCEFDSEVNP